MKPNSLSQILEDIEIQLDSAYEKHGSELWTRHEFYGVLKEEVDELWDVIKQDGPSEDLYSELIQVALVCIRYANTGCRQK